MKHIMTKCGIATAVLLLAAAAMPAAVSAQASELDSSQALDFLGNWTVTLQSEMGPLPITLNIADQSGKLAVEFGSDQGTESVQNVTRNGETLVLTFMADAQGQAVDVVINLTRDGEGIRANISAMQGTFVASGTGTRAS